MSSLPGAQEERATTCLGACPTDNPPRPSLDRGGFGYHFTDGPSASAVDGIALFAELGEQAGHKRHGGSSRLGFFDLRPEV